MSLFSIPRTAVLARILMTEGEPQSGQLYLMERVPQHDGPETVVEMLNRREAFFAFRPDAGDEVRLLAKGHTVSVSLDSQAPIADPARLSAATLLALEIVLAGGSTLNGWASAELPPEHSRLLDYLNASQDPFFVLWTHAATHYVNRAHVLYARPLD